ncbi:hypothetical protein [Amphritea sp. HPY]|uniref:hypothetical protein n=1 Tax=Amphritea sp. HPY TaxID=3421652 RepID=UPI003D7F0946
MNETRRHSSLKPEDLIPLESSPWVFAKDIYVTDTADGSQHTNSYDDRELESEGHTHRALRHNCLNALQQLGYLTYDGGIGIKGHNGFCDGAGQRGYKQVLFECLSDWAVRDLEQLQRKLKFADTCTLILVLTKKGAKHFRLSKKLKRITLNEQVIVATPYKEDDSWSLHFSPPYHPAISPVDKPMRVELHVIRKRFFTYYTIKDMDKNMSPSFSASIEKRFRRVASDVIKNRFNGNNQRNTNTEKPFNFIARSKGKEIARYSASDTQLDITIKVTNEDADKLEPKFHALSEELELEMTMTSRAVR